MTTIHEFKNLSKTDANKLIARQLLKLIALKVAIAMAIHVIVLLLTNKIESKSS